MSLAQAQSSEAKPGSSSSTPLRWGVIGCGSRAIVAHIPVISSLGNGSELAALCDVSDQRLQAGLKKAGKDVPTYRDYQKLLANTDIAAVVIATPNLLHKEMVIAAIQAGKHVMCEKPMAVSLEECRAMKRAAEAAPKQVVLYTMQLHYSTRWEEMRRQIEAGKIGKPRFAVFVESRGDWNRNPDVWQYDDPKQGKVNWRLSQAATGGTLNEKVCHFFDVMHWMMGGVPQRVTGEGGIAVYKDGRDTWDHASTTMEYADGARGVHTLCMFGPHRQDLQIAGEEGALSAIVNDLVFHKRGGRRAPPEPIKFPDEIAHGERGPAKGMETAVIRMYQDFIDCVATGRKPTMDADKAMASCKTAWLAELSAKQKQQVAWDAEV